MAAMRSDQRHVMRSFVPSRRGFWNNDTTRDGANGGERMQVDAPPIYGGTIMLPELPDMEFPTIT